MRTNSVLVAVALLLSMTCAASNFIEISKQDDHFMNLHDENYVLAVFYDSKKQSKLQKPLRALLDKIAASSAAKINNVKLELVDTHKQPFFDEHYDLAGKPAVKLFVRNQMIKNSSLSEKLIDLAAKGNNGEELAQEVQKFVDSSIAGISVHLDNIEALRELVRRDRVVGVYTGADGPNFVRFFRVARKNIDFSFAHTFDAKLIAQIYDEFGHQSPVPEADTFAVIRTSGSLTEFDPSPLIPFTDFDERTLTEFIEFERYDKLRPASQTRNIFQKLFLKYQPLLLHVVGDSATENLAAFGAAVKLLPKNMIYAHTDPDSSDASPFHQLFMQAGESLEPGSVNIVHSGPDKKISITPFKGTFSAENVKNFASQFMSDKAEFFRSARDYLYDKVDSLTGHERKNREDRQVDAEL